MSDTPDDYQLIDPEALDWEKAQQYQSFSFPNNDFSRMPSLGETVSVIFADKSMYWLTLKRETVIVHVGDPIVKSPYGSINRHDRDAFFSRHMVSDIFSVPFGLDSPKTI